MITKETDTLASILLDSPIVVFRAHNTDGWPLVLISENISAMGYSASDLIKNATPLKKLIRTDNWASIETELTTSLKTSVLYSDSVRLIDANGAHRIIEMHLSLLKDPETSDDYIQGTFHEAEVEKDSAPNPVEPTDTRQHPQVKNRFKRQQGLLLKLIDSLPLLITVYDKANNLTFVNKTFARETGYDNDYIQNHSIFHLLFPDPANPTEIHKQLHSEIYEWREIEIKKRDGKAFKSSWNNFALSEDIRVGIGINKSTMLDIEKTLHFYRKQLQIIANQMEDVVFTVDNNKRYTGVFGTWLQKVGYTQDDFLGKTAAEFFGDIGARIHDQHHEKALQGIPSIYEFRVSSNGQDYWMQTLVSPLRDQKGVIIGAVGISRDISQFKKVNEQLNLQDYALQVSANAIVIVDEEGRIFWANEALSTLTGYEISEVLGKHTRMFRSGKQNKTFYKNLWDSVTRGKVWKGELINKKKDGSLYVEEQTITPFTGSNGKPFFISVKQDITERVEREENLRMAYKEKQTLLEEVHHRVKNNLALVSGLLELQMTTSTERDAEVLKRSQQRIHTMALIHEKLYQHDYMSEVLIDEYCTRLVKDTESVYRIPEHDIQIFLQCDPISLNINQAIPFALVCNEMITNAFTHAFKDKRNGKIDVTILSKGSHIELTVADNGVGIQNEQSRESHVSLGLTIMEELTKQLNGKLSIVSNHGTTARLTFKRENLRGSHSYNL